MINLIKLVFTLIQFEWDELTSHMSFQQDREVLEEYKLKQQNK